MNAVERKGIHVMKVCTGVCAVLANFSENFWLFNKFIWPCFKQGFLEQSCPLNNVASDKIPAHDYNRAQ